MSKAGVTAGGGNATSDLEAIVDESARLMKELAFSRKIRRLLMLGFLLFVGVSGWKFYELYQRVRSPENLNEITRLAQTKLQDNSDRYAKEVQTLVEQATPIITEAFYKQAKQDLPAFLRRAGEQRDILVTNLQERLTTRMDEHYHGILDRHEKILEEELPSAKDPEARQRLRTNLGIVFDRMVQRYYGDELKGQLVALYDRWDHFPAAAEPTGPGEPSLEDQFIGTLLDLLAHKLTQAPGGASGGSVAASTTSVPAATLTPARPRDKDPDATPEPKPAEDQPAEEPKPAEDKPAENTPPTEDAR